MAQPPTRHKPCMHLRIPCLYISAIESTPSGPPRPLSPDLMSKFQKHQELIERVIRVIERNSNHLLPNCACRVGNCYGNKWSKAQICALLLKGTWTRSSPRQLKFLVDWFWFWICGYPNDCLSFPRPSVASFILSHINRHRSPRMSKANAQRVRGSRYRLECRIQNFSTVCER
jgi:hypothetical protein